MAPSWIMLAEFYSIIVFAVLAPNPCPLTFLFLFVGPSLVPSLKYMTNGRFKERQLDWVKNPQE